MSFTHIDERMKSLPFRDVLDLVSLIRDSIIKNSSHLHSWLWSTFFFDFVILDGTFFKIVNCEHVCVL